MGFQVVTLSQAGRVLARYRRTDPDKAQALLEKLAAAGHRVRIIETDATDAPVTRKNPGELLILGGFAANPTKTRGMQAAEKAFETFHDGAEAAEILELEDDAVPPGPPLHLFVLGELVSLVYEVPGHSAKAPGAPFKHMLGEVGRSTRVVKANRPLLCGTTDGKYLVIVHRHAPGSKRTYRVKPEGIVG